MAITTAPVTTTHVTRGQQRLLTRTTGIAMIVVSLGYFAVQAKDALQQADDATSFAVLLAQNICRVRPEAKPATATQVAVIQPKTSNQTYFSVPDE